MSKEDTLALLRAAQQQRREADAASQTTAEVERHQREVLFKPLFEIVKDSLELPSPNCRIGSRELVQFQDHISLLCATSVLFYDSSGNSDVYFRTEMLNGRARLLTGSSYTPPVEVSLEGAIRKLLDYISQRVVLDNVPTTSELRVALRHGTIKLEVTEVDGGRSGQIIESFLTGELDPDDLDHDIDHAVESIVLAHACSGVDVESESYCEGLSDALEHIANNLQ